MENIEELEIPTCIPTLGTKKTRRLKRLIERARHLKQMIKFGHGSAGSLGYYEGELVALRWVIGYILIKENVLDAEEMGTKKGKRLKRLKRRAKYLELKIEHNRGSENSLRYGRGELSALKWAIEYVYTKESTISARE
ncbi:MAG: hypothetical protein WC788_01320 [Candidatus Paceibacterota bacterium]|jgi:hypothetical protein